MRRHVPDLLKAIATVACLIAVVRITDWNALTAALRAVANRPAVVIAALGLYSLGFVLRAVAWSAVLPVPVPLQDRLRALYAMLGINHVIPGPVGEVARARLVSSAGLPIKPALASVVAARIADVVALLLLAGAASAILLPKATPAIVAIAMLLIPVTVVVARRLDIDVRARPLVRATCWAVPGWAAEVAVILAVASAAGFALSLAGATLALAAGVLSKAVALLPGGIGTFEAAMTASLALSGVPEVEGVAIAATTHAVLFAYAYLAGGAVVLTTFYQHRSVLQGVQP